MPRNLPSPACNQSHLNRWFALQRAKLVERQRRAAARSVTITLANKPIDRWLYEALATEAFPLPGGGSIPFRDGVSVPKAPVRQSYESFTTGEDAPPWSAAVRRLNALIAPHIIRSHRPRKGGQQHRVLVFPPLADMREAFAKNIGLSIEWPVQQEPIQ